MKFEKCDKCNEYRECYTKTSFGKTSRVRQYFKYPIKYLCVECLQIIDETQKTRSKLYEELKWNENLGNREISLI